MFMTNKIFGVGPKNFRFLCNDSRYYVSDFSCSTHPHNTFLQLLAETGILGTFFFLLCILFFFFYSLKHAYLRYFKGIIYFNNFQICILASILISISIVNPSGNFFNNWLSSVYFYPMGMLFWSLNVNNHNSKVKVL
jgi:O-antigen ligase